MSATPTDLDTEESSAIEQALEEYLAMVENAQAQLFPIADKKKRSMKVQLDAGIAELRALNGKPGDDDSGLERAFQFNPNKECRVIIKAKNTNPKDEKQTFNAFKNFYPGITLQAAIQDGLLFLPPSKLKVALLREKQKLQRLVGEVSIGNSIRLYQSLSDDSLRQRFRRNFMIEHHITGATFDALVEASQQADAKGALAIWVDKTYGEVPEGGISIELELKFLMEQIEHQIQRALETPTAADLKRIAKVKNSLDGQTFADEEARQIAFLTALRIEYAAANTTMIEEHCNQMIDPPVIDGFTHLYLRAVDERSLGISEKPPGFDAYMRIANNVYQQYLAHRSQVVTRKPIKRRKKNFEKVKTHGATVNHQRETILSVESTEPGVVVTCSYHQFGGLLRLWEETYFSGETQETRDKSSLASKYILLELLKEKIGKILEDARTQGGKYSFIDEETGEMQLTYKGFQLLKHVTDEASVRGFFQCIPHRDILKAPHQLRQVMDGLRRIQRDASPLGHTDAIFDLLADIRQFTLTQDVLSIDLEQLDGSRYDIPGLKALGKSETGQAIGKCLSQIERLRLYPGDTSADSCHQFFKNKILALYRNDVDTDIDRDASLKVIVAEMDAVIAQIERNPILQCLQVILAKPALYGLKTRDCTQIKKIVSEQPWQDLVFCQPPHTLDTTHKESRTPGNFIGDILNILESQRMLPGKGVRTLWDLLGKMPKGGQMQRYWEQNMPKALQQDKPLGALLLIQAIEAQQTPPEHSPQATAETAMPPSADVSDSSTTAPRPRAHAEWSRKVSRDAHPLPLSQTMLIEKQMRIFPNHEIDARHRDFLIRDSQWQHLLSQLPQYEIIPNDPVLQALQRLYSDKLYDTINQGGDTVALCAQFQKDLNMYLQNPVLSALRKSLFVLEQCSDKQYALLKIRSIHKTLGYFCRDTLKQSKSTDENLVALRAAILNVELPDALDLSDKSTRKDRRIKHGLVVSLLETIDDKQGADQATRRVYDQLPNKIQKAIDGSCLYRDKRPEAQAFICQLYNAKGIDAEQQALIQAIRTYIEKVRPDGEVEMDEEVRQNRHAKANAIEAALEEVTQNGKNVMQVFNDGISDPHLLALQQALTRHTGKGHMQPLARLMAPKGYRDLKSAFFKRTRKFAPMVSRLSVLYSTRADMMQQDRALLNEMLSRARASGAAKDMKSYLAEKNNFHIRNEIISYVAVLFRNGSDEKANKILAILVDIPLQQLHHLFDDELESAPGLDAIRDLKASLSEHRGAVSRHLQALRQSPADGFKNLKQDFQKLREQCALNTSDFDDAEEAVISLKQ